MKKIMMSAAVVFALLLLSSSGETREKAGAEKTDVGETPAQATSVDALPRGFTEQYIWDKVDPELQQAYRDALAAGDPLRRFDCFVRDQDVIGQGDRSFLISKGFNVRTVGGNVASGYMQAQNLPLVAALPFVSKIRLSKQPGS